MIGAIMPRELSFSGWLLSHPGGLLPDIMPHSIYILLALARLADGFGGKDPLPAEAGYTPNVGSPALFCRFSAACNDGIVITMDYN
jgi:hypothetical protein